MSKLFWAGTTDTVALRNISPGEAVKRAIEARACCPRLLAKREAYKYYFYSLARSSSLQLIQPLFHWSTQCPLSPYVSSRSIIIYLDPSKRFRVNRPRGKYIVSRLGWSHALEKEFGFRRSSYIACQGNSCFCPAVWGIPSYSIRVARQACWWTGCGTRAIEKEVS
jgi:hypothetical protein